MDVEHKPIQGPVVRDTKPQRSGRARTSLIANGPDTDMRPLTTTKRVSLSHIAFVQY